MTKISTTPPLKSLREALSSGGDTTINSYFDENIDGIKLDNIVMIMTIINVNGSLTTLTLRSATTIYYTDSLRAMALHSTILIYH
jgi:hypothetical protein